MRSVPYQRGDCSPRLPIRVPQARTDQQPRLLQVSLPMPQLCRNAPVIPQVQTVSVAASVGRAVVASVLAEGSAQVAVQLQGQPSVKTVSRP